MTQDMTGKVALVTGGGSGIGRATALALAGRGAKVVIADIDEKGGAETLQMVEASGGQGIFIKTDVSQAKEVAAMVAKAVQTYGQLDYAHNNAGTEGVSVPMTEYPEDVWDRSISINLKGVWLCLKYEIPAMQQGRGAIVNTSSMAGLGAVPNASAYIASKHGVIGLTKAAAVENPGIRVNAVCPGPIDTPMMERILSQSGEAYADSLGTPESIAEAVVWLFSDAASAVNGHAMVMGGYI